MLGWITKISRSHTGIITQLHTLGYFHRRALRYPRACDHDIQYWARPENINLLSDYKNTYHRTLLFSMPEYEQGHPNWLGHVSKPDGQRQLRWNVIHCIIFWLHSDLIGVCLVISRLSKTVSDLLLPVDDLQRQANAYASKHKDGPLPSERIDGDTLTTRLVALLQLKSACK